MGLRYHCKRLPETKRQTADREAKRAEGLRSNKNLLPVHLRCKLTISPSAVQQDLNAEVKQSWTHNWRNHKRGKSFAKIDKSTLAHFLRSITNVNISSKSASLITQLLTEHIPLNAYLKRFKRRQRKMSHVRGRPRNSKTLSPSLPMLRTRKMDAGKHLNKRNIFLTSESLLL